MFDMFELISIESISSISLKEKLKLTTAALIILSILTF